jgi:hypothetical protein
MSTDWAGSSMKVYPISEPYEQSLGALRDAMEGGLTASDPAKVAQVVLQLVELDEVPQKLLLGSDAVTVAGAFEQARAESDAQWIELSRSTDHDNVAPEMLDPLAHL